MAERLMAAGTRPGERGFTIIEVLIALVVLLLGMAGILSLQLTSVEATAYSRHATEASILGEDKMEDLRTQPLLSLTSGIHDTEGPVNARAESDPDGLYTRVWTVTPGPDATTIRVDVTWSEQGTEAHTITLRTQRVK